jgi:hypothetical protein
MVIENVNGCPWFPVIKSAVSYIMKVEYILSFITIFIGVFVAFVGYQQYSVNKERFKLDLFEKRFNVYDSIRVLLIHMLSGAVLEPERLFKFRADTEDALFLFKEDVTNYIKLVDKKAVEYINMPEKLRAFPEGELKSKVREEKICLMNWILKQQPQLQEVFAPYLKFKTWN